MPDDIGTQDVIALVKDAGLPLTRENFIAVNWGKPPRPWTIEHEAQLPEALQDWSRFTARRRGPVK